MLSVDLEAPTKEGETMTLYEFTQWIDSRIDKVRLDHCTKCKKNTVHEYVAFNVYKNGDTTE